MDVERLQRLYLEAVNSPEFTAIGPRRGVWDLSRDCDNPVPVTLFSRSTGLVRNLRLIANGSRRPPSMMEIVLLTECRKCPVCLKRRSRMWAARAWHECQISERTWFGTLTCAPDWHVWCDSVCATKKANFVYQTEFQKFGARAQVLGVEVTKYLKKIRKNSGRRFRYLLVSEYHDSERTSDFMRFRPHLHLLVHEFAGQPLRKHDDLEANWTFGWSSWKLVKSSMAAGYVTKYISKAADARVRASLRYGKLESETCFTFPKQIRPLDIDFNLV